MRHLAAYLLLVVGGNSSPSADDITKLLGTVGVDVDSPRLDQLLAELEGKSIEELIALGQDKLYVGGGAGGAVASTGAAPATGGADAAPAKEPEKAKPKEEEVDALDGGMDMFGGGGGGGGDY